MELATAYRETRDLMDEQGLLDWEFGWSRGTSTFGTCNFNQKLIRLSKPLVLLNSEAHVLDTIRHEVAHALAGRGAGHGPEWKVIAARLGARPKATYNPQVDGVVTPPPAPPRYTATHYCGKVFTKSRLPSRPQYCSVCYKRMGFADEARLAWFDTRTETFYLTVGRVLTTA